MSSKSKSTVVIWSNYQDGPMFYAVQGDLRYLNDLYINLAGDWQQLLTATYGEGGNEPFKWQHSEIPITGLKAAIEAADYVIHCGEVP